MKTIVFSFLICLISFNTFSQRHKSSNEVYKQKYLKLSKKLSEKYGIPNCVILGVAIVETNYGKSKNCKLLKNHFGIVGKNKYSKSKRYKSRYKQYSSDYASFLDFVKKISQKSYYSKLKDKNNCELWIDEISKNGYSEKPQIWKERVMLIIKKENL